MTVTATKASTASANELQERVVMLIRALLCELELAHEANDTARLGVLADGLGSLVAGLRTGEGT